MASYCLTLLLFGLFRTSRSWAFRLICFPPLRRLLFLFRLVFLRFRVIDWSIGSSSTSSGAKSSLSTSMITTCLLGFVGWIWGMAWSEYGVKGSHGIIVSIIAGRFLVTQEYVDLIVSLIYPKTRGFSSKM